jgi:hypothetical protein
LTGHIERTVLIMIGVHVRRVVLAAGSLVAGVSLLAVSSPAAQAQVDRPQLPTDKIIGTKMVISYQSGRGESKLWTLDCEESEGSHPTPKRACAALDENGARALRPTPPTTPCTLQYGGPQTAQVTGTLGGKPVVALLSRSNGCEIARWNALAGLVPQH